MITRLALLALCSLAPACRALAAEPAHAHRSRFYAGMTLAALDFDDNYRGIALSDSSTGLGVYGGFRLKDRLALELSYDSFDAIDLTDIAGSGIVRLDVETERRTATLSVLREVSFKELFDWRRDWRIYGTAGVYDSELRGTVTARGASSTSTRSFVHDSDTGLVFGAGALYALGRFELRGFVLSGSDVREYGAAV